MPVSAVDVWWALRVAMVTLFGPSLVASARGAWIAVAQADPTANEALDR